MILRPAAGRPAGRPRTGFTLMEVLVTVAILVVLATISSIFVFRYLENSKKGKAKLDMQSLVTAYKTCMTNNGNNEVNYPSDLIPLMDQGQAAFVDPWGGQYQVQVIQTEQGPRPQFSTTAPDGDRIVWPRQ